MRNNKERYCVGFYELEERINNEEMYFNISGNVLVSYIIDNIELFDLRNFTNKIEEIGLAWITLKTSELEKIKPLLKDYKYNNKQEILDFIDICMDYDAWATACECCDTITLNTFPYTYRGNVEIYKIYNCLNCAGYTDRYAFKIKDILEKKGTEAAIKISLGEETCYSEEDKFFCQCGADLRCTGAVYDGKKIIKFDKNLNKDISLDIDKYNELELKNNNIMPILYDKKYCPDTDGYRCIICNNELPNLKIEMNN